MCLDYVNCGNKFIEKNAEIIANNNGYEIISDIGSYGGPVWGNGLNE